MLSSFINCQAGAQTAPAKEPVFIYLDAFITDQVNLDLTEDRLRRLLPEIEKYRKAHAEAHVSAVVFFSGASSDALAQRNAQTHIVDFVKDYIQRGVIEAAYDGSDEPTYENRPEVNFSTAKGVEDRWMVREHAAESLLTEGRDPITGAPIPGKEGGLKRMQEVFGEAACIRGIAATVNMMPSVTSGTDAFRALPKGPTVKNVIPILVPELGGDSETVEVIRRYNTKAIMFGLAEDNPAALPGFGGSLQSFGALVSPIPESAPEIYWQDNVLRTSESSNPSEAAAEKGHDYQGLNDLKDDFKELDRKKMHVMHLDLADERYYLQHPLTKDSQYPLKYAYEHPESPKLPAEALLSKAEVDAAFAKEDAALQWITAEFLPANPGSRFVSNAELQRMTGPSAGFSVSVEALRGDLKGVLDNWAGNTFPPPYFHVAGHYLSLADLFLVLTDALAEQDRTGKLPAAVQVVPVYGPNYTVTGHGPNVGEVTATVVAHFCAGLSATLHDASIAPIPKNMIPNEVSVDGNAMNSAQFLRLMAKALEAPSPDTKIEIKMTYMFPGQAQIEPKTRKMSELGAMWTVKPAPLTAVSVAAK
jgi:hypothetical protein